MADRGGDGGDGGDVVHLRSRRGYAPDLRGLASGQVASARQRLGLSAEEFAERLGALLDWQPSPEVVESWERSVVPPGDVLLAAVLAVQDVPGEVLTFPLRPGAERTADLLAAISPAIGQTLDSDVITSYATRGEIARPEWNKMIAGSTEQLWLYGMAEFGYAVDDEVPGILAEAAAGGCEVRVLLLDPDYPGVPEIDAEEGNPAGHAGAASASRARSLRADACGVRPKHAGPHLQRASHREHLGAVTTGCSSRPTCGSSSVATHRRSSFGAVRPGRCSIATRGTSSTPGRARDWTP